LTELGIVIAWRINRELRTSNPSEYAKAIRSLNEISSEAWASYEKIIEIGRVEYGVEII
jgi:hypothetical protein